LIRRDNRVRVEPNILDNIMDDIKPEVVKELTPNPTTSLIVNVALLKYIALRDNAEIEMIIDKNEKLAYKIK
jgi:hypothetical protein